MTESLPPEDPRDALIREQAGRLMAQEVQIAALTVLVAELRGQLEAALRSASRNSGNSWILADTRIVEHAAVVAL